MMNSSSGKQDDFSIDKATANILAQFNLRDEKVASLEKKLAETEKRLAETEKQLAAAKAANERYLKELEAFTQQQKSNQPRSSVCPT